ncbi:hypothetical protein HHI36_007941 [Cryptolaemus montrouzieri]
MAECVVSEANKNIIDSSNQSSDVQSCQDIKTEKVMEPLLLEDFQRSRFPTTLKNIMKSFEKQGIQPSKCDFLVGCLYTLMLEYGFIPQEKESFYNDCGFNYSRIKDLVSFPAWKKSDENSYSLSFILPPHHIYTCKVICIKMGDDLIVNAIVKNIEDVHHTIMLDILSYFTDGAHQKACMDKMQNLRSLSTSFKNQVAFPVKHAILRTNGLRHPCLEDLPLEIIFYIFKYIHGTDIIKFTAISKQFHSMRLEVKLWENLILRDFKCTVKKTLSYEELMKEYGYIYRSQLRNRRHGSWKKRMVL